MRSYVMKNQKQLRVGITTGTCAAAAAKCAAFYLLSGEEAEAAQNVTVKAPGGEQLQVSVQVMERQSDKCTCEVIKDSGDDPDVTNGVHVMATVAYTDGEVDPHAFWYAVNPALRLDGGTGVGRVTKAGLEQSPGQAAINVVPRRMIFEAVQDVYETYACERQLLITIQIPQGVELAKQTFNPRLGIEGGISVLGTSGMVEPMSERAIIDTIETEIRQKHIQGVERLLVTPGNYGQRYVQEYLHMDIEDGVKCSNYIGETIDLAISYEMKELLLVGNIGKLVKLAAGIMNTHSRVADGRCEIVALHTVLCGGTRNMAEQIMHCINTEEMLDLLEAWGLRQAVLDGICGKIREHMEHRIRGRMKFRVMLFSEKYGFLGEVQGGQE